MSIVTREIINKNIKFLDIDEDKVEYDYNSLSAEIDKFKNLLEKYNAKKGQSILIGITANVKQIAMIFAAFELGLIVTIVDYARSDHFQQYEYMDPKTDILLPIDFFVAKKENDTDKYVFFKKKCKKTIVLKHEKDLDYTPNNKIECTPDSEIIKCTSSGTTGTPKKITHTHEFFYKLAKRNTVFFDETVALGYNLNHGSSVATYFLPALASEKVKKFVNLLIDFDSPKAAVESDNKIKKHEISHIMFPYNSQLKKFLRFKNPHTTIYTLSTISSEFKSQKLSKRYKDIISFFGSNETSGPVFFNRANDERYSEDSYFKIDDFYNIDVVDEKLNVTLPVYNTTIDTNDCFYVDNDIYYFVGRKDLLRINGKNVLVKSYSDIVKKYTDGDLVYDYKKQKIYLAIWQDVDDPNKIAKKINKKLAQLSEGDHGIIKISILDKEEFLTGVKLDQELLREYFRKYVT